MSNLTRTHREAEKRLEVVYRHPLARMIVSALGAPPPHVIERAHAQSLKVAGLIGHPKHAKTQVEPLDGLRSTENTTSTSTDGTAGLSVTADQAT